METITQKVELRDRMRVKLAALSLSEVRAKSAAIWERLAVFDGFASAECALIYVSKGHEVGTHGLIQQLLAMGRRVCVPKFDEGTQHYVVSELRDFQTELVEGKFHILEPKPGAVRVVHAGQLQALLVPGLAFDETGNRLGRGMGFFDAILRGAHGTKIALAYDFQMLKEVPVEPHDVAVDFIVTETKTLKCSKG